MELEMEKTTYNSSNIGIETREDGPPVITGHAAVFNQIESGGWFREQVAPGAFSESLKQDDIRALWNHDTAIVLGRNRNGTLKLWEDERGLAVEITPPDTQMARDLIENIKRGDVTQMSIGFEIVDRMKDVDWAEEDGEDKIRTIKKAKLWEVSPVTFPFYKSTDVSIKAEYRQWQESRKKPVYKSKFYRRRLELDLR